MLKLRYEKTGKARWISHLDMMHMMQRAFLRAGIAIKHSEGYHPHAYVSINLPLSVGQESLCELLEFAIVDGTPPAGVPERLNAVLPEGLRAVECYESDCKVRELALLQVRVTLEYDHGAPDPAVIAELFAREQLPVEKRTKKGLAEVDIRPLIQKMEVRPCEDGLVLEAVLSAQNPGLNPELLGKAIATHLPTAVPDFVRVLREETLTADGGVFR